MNARAEAFKHRVSVSRAAMPRARKLGRLPRKQEPLHLARDYFTRMRPLLEAARRAVLARVGPLLEGLAVDARLAREDVRADAGADFNAAMDQVSKAFFDGLNVRQIEALAREFADKTARFEREQAQTQVRAAFGVDVLAGEPNIAGRVGNFVAENVALIKTIPSQFFDQVEKEVMRSVSQGASAAQLAKVIQDRYGVAEDRARLIARDQTGKFFGQVAEARQKNMGVTHYVWRTSNDERVREEHAAREGDRFAWDDPPEGGHPGEDFQCRCYAEPDLSALLDDAPAEDVSSEPTPDVAPPPEPDVAVAPPLESTPPAPPIGPNPDELEAARRGHAEQLSLRLAEQELARAERDRANADRTRLEAEARAAEQARVTLLEVAKIKTTPVMRDLLHAVHTAEQRGQPTEFTRAGSVGALEARGLVTSDGRAVNLTPAGRTFMQVHGENIAAEVAARAVAEANARAQAEADRHAAAEAARLAAEEHARQIAVAEEARKAAERAAFEAQKAQAAAEQGKNVPLGREHRLVGTPFAHEREARLEELRAKPIDAERLANALALSDGRGKKAQAAAREELNRIVAHEGARMSVLEQGTGAKSLEVHKMDALGMYYPNGGVAVSSPQALQDASAFFRAHANGVMFEARLAGEDEARRAFLAAIGDARKAVDAATNVNLTKKQREALRPAAEAASARAEALRPAAAEAENARREAKAASTLLHETFHGHSPEVSLSVYRGVGVPVEEVSTEMAARATLERRFGVRDDLVSTDVTQRGASRPVSGSYDNFILPVTEHSARVASELGLHTTTGDAYAKLKDASLAMKSDHTFLSRGPEDHLSTLVKKMAAEYHFTPEQALAYEEKMKQAFRDDIVKRK